MQKVSHTSEVWQCVKQVHASSEDEDAPTISDMEAARQGLLCSSGNKAAILMSEKGWLLQFT